MSNGNQQDQQQQGQTATDTQQIATETQQLNAPDQQGEKKKKKTTLDTIIEHQEDLEEIMNDIDGKPPENK